MAVLQIETLASAIDASIGGTPAATEEEVLSFFRSLQLDKHKFAAVMVEPCYVKFAADYLHQRGQKLVTVISYPLGAMTTVAKVVQAEQALADGADELDIAIDLSAFRSGDFQQVVDDLRTVRRTAGDRIVKAIYYSAVLTDQESIKAAGLILDAGITFLKTNPGYGNVTTPHHIAVIKKHFKDEMKVMASGGVRTYEDAMAMIDQGADRVATSSVASILERSTQR
jgi:deoxyribose-phosphate aldolase